MIEIKENTPLAPFTMYKIGGPARYFAEVKSSEELQEALRFVAQKKVPFFVLGAGSNILVHDDGFRGLAVRLKGGEVKCEDNLLLADAGVMMSAAALYAAKNNLSGFEWGIGIPGTVGGSVRGNAGCFGGEISQIVEQVQLLEFSVSNFQFSNKLKILELSGQECEFGYRDSVFKKHPEWTILSATFKLQKGHPEEIKEKIKKITLERTSKQDIGTQSCGCIFKNISWDKDKVNRLKVFQMFPEIEIFKGKPHIPASFLIDRAGLKGRQVGQIFISPKHANYFVNKGGGSAREVAELVKIAKDKVEEKFGLKLQEEIQYIGF